MMYLKSMVVLFGLFLVASCQSDPTPTTNSAALKQSTGGITIEYETTEVRSENCQSDTSNCAVVKLNYPLFKGPENLVTVMNDSIEASLISLLTFGNDADSPEIHAVSPATEAFFEAYSNSKEESPDFTHVWTVEMDGEVILQTSKIVSVVLNHYSYTGGAHPNTYAVFYTFDLSTGRPVRLAEAFTDLDKLQQLAEASFREARGIPADQSWEDSGFFWGTSFSFPEYYAFLENSMVFFYNPYEAAAYAEGPTEFEIPYDQLELIMTPEMIAKLGRGTSL